MNPIDSQGQAQQASTVRHPKCLGKPVKGLRKQDSSGHIKVVAALCNRRHTGIQSDTATPCVAEGCASNPNQLAHMSDLFGEVAGVRVTAGDDP